MSSSVNSIQQSVSASVKLPLLPQTLSALLFGAVIVLAVGFAPMDFAHNAAHDTRHALAFPCH